MRFKLLLAIIFSCIAFSNAYALESKKLDMFDKGRSRTVPMVIYQGETINKHVAIISHGYGAKNTEYSLSVLSPLVKYSSIYLIQLSLLILLMLNQALQ